MPIYVCEYCRREYNTRDLLERITPHATAESRARAAGRSSHVRATSGDLPAKRPDSALCRKNLAALRNFFSRAYFALCPLLVALRRNTRLVRKYFERIFRRCWTRVRQSDIISMVGGRIDYREATDLQITIITDASPDAWGEDCSDELAAVAAERLADRLAAFARDEWPEADVRTATRSYHDGESHRLVELVGASYEREMEIARRIGDEAEAIWQDAIDETA